MRNKVLIFSYYEDIWLDIDLLPIKKSDVFAIVEPQLEKYVDLSNSYLYKTFNKFKRTGFIDKVIHALKFYLMLPYLIYNYKSFLFFGPPYFHFLALPILYSFGKNNYTMAGDPYSEIVKERFWQAPLYKLFLRKIMYPIYLFSEFISIKFNKIVFTVSNNLVKKYSQWDVNVLLSRNGADIEKINNIKPVSAVKQSYIYYGGGVLKWRGIDLLIDAFKIVKENYKNPIKLVIAGGTDEEFKYYKEIKSLGEYSKDIVFTGMLPREKALSFLKASKIAVVPHRDTVLSQVISPVKVFEYIAAEVPQVTTDVGDQPIYVKKLNVGIIVKPDKKDIARGIICLIKNKKLYQKLKDNCINAKKYINYKVTRGEIKNILNKEFRV